ncbi:MAG: prepilin-type N-terminal cleavage/methylation domain-containing protein [Burkholderiaceae bacterium]|nr:prepilin-type N-terminal cleavage/methylation domain-containing protein [Burkholderiaceae bacterium]
MPIDDPKRSFKGQKRRRLGQSGFTLIELVMVIVMLGILAVFAAPRMFNNGDFYARGFHDETLALLRFAQKSAIAQRRTVCVAFTSATTTLTIAALAATPACANPLVGPKGESPALITARTGVAYNTLPANFSFDGLGQPSASTTIQVANSGVPISLTITVEAGTGYVHD